MTETRELSVLISTDDYQGLVKLSQHDHRDPSQQAQVILHEALVARLERLPPIDAGNFAVLWDAYLTLDNVLNRMLAMNQALKDFARHYPPDTLAAKLSRPNTTDSEHGDTESNDESGSI